MQKVEKEEKNKREDKIIIFAARGTTYPYGICLVV